MTAQDFRIDLTDPAACGVYFVAPEDIETVEAGAREHDFNVHHLDLAGCRDRDAFAALLAEGFSLPPGYSRNWADLTNYLESLEGLPSRGHVVLMTHPDDWLHADGSGSEQALDWLEDIAVTWSREGVAFFVFVPRDAAEAAARATH